MTHKLDADDFFIHRVEQHCAEAGLNFFLIEPLWVGAFYEGLHQGHLWPRVLVNMHSEHHQPKDIYHRLVRLAQERHTQIIDPLDRAIAAFDKARLHPRLLSHGMQVPFSIIVPSETLPGFRLSDQDRASLGLPFVIKPAMGYGRNGVIMDATGEDDLARSAAAWPDTHYLLQRRIVPGELNGAPAYFRVYFVFGTVWCSWWNCYTDHYRLVTPGEMEEFNLEPLREIIRQMAALTGMKFFSSEIARTQGGEFIVIDYVNDQCHMLSQSANPKIGVPDELVGAIARRLVEATRELIRK